jgi:hypothetical protein
MLGKFDPSEEEAYLDSEQVAMLMAVDPKYKDKYQQSADMENAIGLDQLLQESDDFDRKLPDVGDTTRVLDLNTEIGAISAKKSGKGMLNPPQGGFLQALMPFIPLITQLAGPLINGLFSLGKKRGSGASIQPAVDNFFRKNGRQLMGIEQQITSMKPRQAWETLHGVSRDMVDTILSKTDFGKSPTFREKLIPALMKKQFPNKFVGMLPRTKQGEGKPVPTDYRLTQEQLMRPVIKYAFRKMLGPHDGDQIYNIVKKRLIAGSGLNGGKFDFGNIKRFIQKVITQSLPVIKQVTGKLVTKENIKPIISKLLSKFGSFNGSEQVGDIAADAISGIAKSFSGQGMLRAPNAGMLSAPNAGMLRPPNVTSKGAGKEKKSQIFEGYQLKVY